MAEDHNRFPFGDPTCEYQKNKGFDRPRDIYENHGEVTMHDILVAILGSADAIHCELRRVPGESSTVTS